MSDSRALRLGDRPAGVGEEKNTQLSLADVAGFSGAQRLASITAPPRLHELVETRDPQSIKNMLQEMNLKPPTLEIPGAVHHSNDYYRKLASPDALKLDLMRLELQVASGDEEIRAREQAIRKFVNSQGKGYLSTDGWKEMLSRPGSEASLREIEARRSPAERASSSVTAQARILLTDRAAVAICAQDKLADFHARLTSFDERAKARGLSDAQKTEVYLQLARVLNPENKPAFGTADLVARSIMRNLSSPTSIDQGGHNTCNVTTLECRLYTREPEAAVKVVADVAMTGQFVTHDGSAIRPRGLAPDGEASKDPTPDGERNFASQIFQLTAINIHWMRKDVLPGGVYAGKGNIVYCQDGNGASGEHLLNLSKNPPEVHRFRSLDSAHPWLDLYGISDINEQITGRPSSNLGLERWFFAGEDRGVVKLSSLSSFKEKLTQLKNDGGFPVIVALDAAKKPFGSGDSIWFSPHVVTVTDYDPASGEVSVDNQWGKGGDRTGLPGEAPKMTAEELYKAMSLVPSQGYLWDHIKRNLKDTKLSDMVQPTLTGLSVRGLKYGITGTAPFAVRSGLRYLDSRGMESAGRLLAATESQSGARWLRAGTSIGALAVAAYVNDLPDAFSQGPARGVGRLTRVGLDYAGFELGAGLARGAIWATGMKWAPGRVGLIVAAGAVTATALDRVLGDSSEVAGSYLWERGKDWFRR